jgi:hypothetical protein
MNGKNIAVLARMSKIPYRTVHSYVSGEKRPKLETARILAQITGRGTDEETLAWMSKDSQKIEGLVRNWQSCGSKTNNKRPDCANAPQTAHIRENELENIYHCGERK